MPRGRRKMITDEERVVATSSSKSLEENMQWFYEAVKAYRGKVTDEALANKEKEISDRGLCHLKDVCEILDWQFPRDKDIRNKLSHLGHTLGLASNISSDTYNPIIYSAMVKILKGEDPKDPTDLLLSKKEARASRKRRKILAKAGLAITDVIKVPKSNDSKKEARKARAAIRKAAKAAGMTTAEYKAQQKTDKATA
jgi:hypothetical protein